jgi:hypothetical protein
MLTRVHKVLIGLLAVQLALVVIVLARGSDSGAQKEHPLIADFDAAKVTRLQISSNAGPGAGSGAGADAKSVDLVKKDASWVVASAFDYPVEQGRLNDLLTPIGKLSAAAPIATQASRHKQLRVADTDFERKVVITRDGKDLTLYIGSPAGARRTAVRVGGDDNVYAVTGLSITNAGTEARQWVEMSYVKQSREDIAKLTVQRDGKSIELVRSPHAPSAPSAVPAPAAPAGAGSGAGSAAAAAGSGSAGSAGSGSAAAAGSGSAGGAGSGSGLTAEPPAADHWWVTMQGTPVALAAGESIDESACDRVAGQAIGIDMSKPADPKRDASKPTATITIDHKPTDKTAAPTVIDVVADGESYWVKDRSLPRAVLVDKARLDELVNVDRDKLIKKPPPPPPPAPKGGPAGAGSAATPKAPILTPPAPTAH